MATGRGVIGIVSQVTKYGGRDPKLEVVAVCTDPAKARSATPLTYKTITTARKIGIIFYVGLSMNPRPRGGLERGTVAAARSLSLCERSASAGRGSPG